MDMGTLIQTQCSCGEPITVEYDSHWQRTCRSDLRRPHYPDNDPRASATVFRCRGCSKPVNETVPEAAYGPVKARKEVTDNESR